MSLISYCAAAAVGRVRFGGDGEGPPRGRDTGGRRALGICS